METIIKKAIEGGYDKKYIPVIGIDFPRHHTTVTTILMDREFWQALHKACKWDEDLERGVTGFHLKGIGVALRFHEINLTEGWDSAVKYLEDLVK